VLLERIALDATVIDGESVSLMEVFEIEEETESARIDEAVEVLSGIVSTPPPPRNTSLIMVTAATEWPSVSLFIVQSLVDGIKEFNQNTVRGQAGAERRFVEDRLEVARADLRTAEDDLESFLNNNKQYDGSPELTFQRDRLDRTILLRQEVFTSLSQTLEEVRIREVRDLPVISMVEQPSVQSRPAPRGRAIFVVLGSLIGGFAGVLLSLGSEAKKRLRNRKDNDVEEFITELKETMNEFLLPISWLRRRLRR